MKHITQYFKKNKIHSIFNLAGLSIGFSVVTIIAFYIMTEYNKDQNIPNNENIYRLYDKEANSVGLDYSLYNDIKEQFPEVENNCVVRTFYGYDCPITTEKNYSVEKIFFMTTNKFFDVFDIKILKSASDNLLPDDQSAVITQSLAKKLYPGEDPIGKKINFFGFLDFTISAVVQNFDNNSLNCNFIIHADNPNLKNWGQENKTTLGAHYLVVNKETNLKNLESRLSSYYSKLKHPVKTIGLQPLKDIYLASGDMEYNANDKGNVNMLKIFMTIAVLILFLSIANNLNYEFSMQFNNLKNISIHKSNGANNSQLLKQSIGENFIKVLLAAALSIIVTFIFLPLAKNLFNTDLHERLFLHSTFIIPAVSLIILVTFINSLSTIYFLSRFDIRSFLSSGKNNTSTSFWKKALLIFQLTSSILLLISIFTIKKQIFFVKHADLGFDKEQVMYMKLPFTKGNEAKTFKEVINQQSFVKSSSLTNGVPGEINYTCADRPIFDDPDSKSFGMSMIPCDGDFIKTMNIELIAGRDFHQNEKDACIINEAALKKYGWKNFEGKQFKGNGTYNVIGIAKDFNIGSLHSLPVPVVINYDMDNLQQLNIRLTKGDMNYMIKEIEKLWNNIYTSTPFVYTFYDDAFNAMYQKDENTGNVLSIFVIIAVIITILGILGISFQNSLQRTKEIGVRKVNGAKIIEILRLLNTDFIKCVAIAFVIASPIALLFMNKWLQDFAYKTNLSWWVFASAGLIALGIATITVSWQSWKTATMNPAKALKNE